MGTWDAGPFENDAAMDFAGEAIDQLMAPVYEFLEEPQIDETFDAAFAAVAMLNAVMKVCNARPWKDGDTLDPKPVRAALLKCFDDQIDDMDPDPEFKVAQRKSLDAVTAEFVALVSD